VNLRGTGVSPGIASGRALIVGRERAPVFRLLLPPEQVEGEVQRLARAVEASRGQLQVVKERLSREIGSLHAYIFDAQLLMLEDPLLLDRTVATIRESHVNAEWALRNVSEQLHALFSELTDAYLRERTTDLDDVLDRIQLNLLGAQDAPSLSRLPGAFILVAEDLTPSEAAELDWERVLGVATDAGSRTYHTAILARSLGIPAVVGLGDATRRIPAGALVVIDGTRGDVLVEPSAPTLEDYRVLRNQERLEEKRLQDTRPLPSVTLDGTAVRLLANVEFADEASTGLLYGAEGIGLFRSEYLLGRNRGWPKEEEQLEIYRGILESMRPHPVTIRVFDLGPDDVSAGGPSWRNPALGERALRLCHRTRDVFVTQIRALLRIGAEGPLRILFPFVGGPSDLDLALDLVEEARNGLRRDGIRFREDTPIGLSLEVPSAAITVDLLAPRVAFFSVGTNDLIQYLLAVDRVDPRVASLYEPLHPAVLRTIHGVVKAAESFRIPLSLSGEMAADPLQALLLVGLGLRELSMSPSSIPRVKAALRAIRVQRAREVALRSLELPTAEKVAACLREAFAEVVKPIEVRKE
jgi:phosphotransferase system enzyme I (PtsI)